MYILLMIYHYIYVLVIFTEKDIKVNVISCLTIALTSCIPFNHINKKIPLQNGWHMGGMAIMQVRHTFVSLSKEEIKIFRYTMQAYFFRVLISCLNLSLYISIYSFKGVN